MKAMVKGAVLAVFWLLALPFGLPAKILHRLTGSSMLFLLGAQFMSLQPGLPGQFLRLCYYRQTLRRSSFTNEFLFLSTVAYIGAEIGDHARIGARSTVSRVRLGDHAVVSNGVNVLSGNRQHNFDDPTRDFFTENREDQLVEIGAHSFIGDGSLIMANVGHHTIVGAGSVVVKDIPDYVVAVGSPARVIKERPRPERA